MPSTSPVRLVLLLLAFVAVAAPSGAAQSDVVILANSDIVYGAVEAAPVSVLTPDGVAQVAQGDLGGLTLGTAYGDVVQYRNGKTLTGTIEQSVYRVKLSSGQTLVLERDRVSVIRFGPR